MFRIFDTLEERITVGAIFSYCLDKLCPSSTVVGGNIPVIVFNFQLWGNAIMPSDRNLFPSSIGNPITVQHPVPYSVFVLCNTDIGRMSIFTVTDDYWRSLSKTDGIARLNSFFVERSNASNIILRLHGGDNRLKGCYFRVQTVAQLFQLSYPIVKITYALVVPI